MAGSTPRSILWPQPGSNPGLFHYGKPCEIQVFWGFCTVFPQFGPAHKEGGRNNSKYKYCKSCGHLKIFCFSYRHRLKKITLENSPKYQYNKSLLAVRDIQSKPAISIDLVGCWPRFDIWPVSQPGNYSVGSSPIGKWKIIIEKI